MSLNCFSPVVQFLRQSTNVHYCLNVFLAIYLLFFTFLLQFSLKDNKNNYYSCHLKIIKAPFEQKKMKDTCKKLVATHLMMMISINLHIIIFLIIFISQPLGLFYSPPGE